jgi:hypothetical protein
MIDLEQFLSNRKIQITKKKREAKHCPLPAQISL